MVAFVHSPRRARKSVSPKTHTPDRHLHISGQRYLTPETGRWISRDPIEEEGGLSLYCFVVNAPLDRLDRLGQRTCFSTPTVVDLDDMNMSEVAMSSHTKTRYPAIEGGRPPVGLLVAVAAFDAGCCCLGGLNYTDLSSSLTTYLYVAGASESVNWGPTYRSGVIAHEQYHRRDFKIIFNHALTKFSNQGFMSKSLCERWAAYFKSLVQDEYIRLTDEYNRDPHRFPHFQPDGRGYARGNWSP